MDHHDHVALLRDGVPAGPRVWADLGAGSGAFTLALADLLGPGGVIYAVDRDRRALAPMERGLHARFPGTTLHVMVADFTGPLALPPLDGVVMANSLHFQRDKPPTLRRVHDLLKPGGRLILVEYDGDRGNHWVPYPLAFTTWQALAPTVGYVDTRLLATCPSRFMGQIYAALSRRPDR